MANLLHTSYPLDKTLALSIALSQRSQAEPYSDHRVPEGMPDWLICHDSSEYIQKVISDIGLECKPRFYYMAENFNLPEHIDNGTKCSLNFILSDNTAPVTIQGQDYYYTQALLNTSVLHGVKNSGTERVLLKLSVFNLDFEQVSNHLKLKGYAQ